MEHLLSAIFGTQDHLTGWQECARALLIFSYGLAILRLSGPRTFGRWSALDIVITIMVGSALARAMTGSAPLLGTMGAAAVLAVCHVALGHWVARDQRVAHIVEGRAALLVKNGKLDEALRKRMMISHSDLREALRQSGVDGEAHLDDVKVMMLEPSGKLSIVKIDPCKADPA